MKRSIFFAFMSVTVLATACGGFTEVGSGSGGAGAHSGGQGTTGGKSATGGAAATGGKGTTGGAAATGGSGGTSEQGGANQGGGANATGAGGASTSPCTTDDQCPRSLAPCQACADGSVACPWARCEDGTCAAGIDQCPGTNPCADKACGDSCWFCEPGETCLAVSMYCDAELKCQLSEPTCATNACKTDADCPGVGACPPCPDGNSCAELKCVAGSCQFQCEGGGSCSAEQGSCAAGETCCAGLECCAGVPVPQGQEYCGKVCPKSDQNMKRDFTSVDPDQVLDRLSRLPIGSWAYRTESPNTRHIGPMAQDFMAAFEVGSSDLTILQIDADGVAFAAIQALNTRLKAVEEKNQELQRELAKQRQRCDHPRP